MKLNFLPYCVIIVLGMVSCSSDQDFVVEPKPNPSGKVSGYVNLYNESTIMIDKSNMTVKIVGSSPVISAVTDTNGYFVLPDVPFGDLALSYEKSGFGTFKKLGIKHPADGSSTIITATPSLGQISSTQITNLTVQLINSDIVLSITTNPSGSNADKRYFRYFLSKDPNVSYLDYTYYSPGLTSQINPYKVTLTKNDLLAKGFLSGEKIYVKAYGDSFWSNEYDVPGLLRIFPNLNSNSANAVSFTL
ncbi:carboxypeptidase-like regulatory domain-containing protein [Chryseobacterium candidae]|uniref:Carboxypeptidase regulatory-like domain-containing protein n=1 Tax=Chryseobacterium candidae TaxID=1978493 RepID=A0ABY2R4P0_9FLAO|nr:carboxypeptidase-like regulatory domain-containing protein [Chryseobacterium candidae]THV57558.1 carboxypeptidase regulatory-like domain-containing protein [Chryseobacterium candidae]